MDLKDKVIVITGAARGLGRALAEKLQVEGAKLVLADVAPELEETASSLQALAVRTDVADEAQVQALAQRALAALGRIDVWVNNAGVWIPHGPVEEVPAERAQKLMGVNFFGTFFGCREALKIIRKQGEGVILNVISARAKEPKADSATYGATKFAADGLTKALREELRPAGIKVLAVYPSGMRTELFRERVPENYAEYMDPAVVAEKIVANLKLPVPEEELVIKKV